MPSHLRGERMGDEAFVEVFEALTIALILSVAFFYILTFDGDSSAVVHARQDVQRAAGDGLDALAHTVFVDARYGNQLVSRAVAEAMQGRTSNLTAYLDHFLPPGAVYNVYLSNGFDRRDLRVVREPTGATAGAAHTFEPRWSVVRSVPDLAVLPTAGDDPVVVTAIPTASSNPFVPMDGLVRFDATGTVGVPGGGIRWFNSTTYAATTTAPVPDPADHASARVSLLCVNGDLTTEPCWTADVVATPNRIARDLVQGWWKPRISIDNEGNHLIPAGATLRVDVPPGAVFGIDITDPEWATDWDLVSIDNGTAQAHQFTARTTAAIAPSDGLELPFFIADPYDDDRLTHAVFTLTFEAAPTDRDARVHTRSFVAVRFVAAPTLTDVPAMVYPSVPFPSAPVGGSSTWAVVLASPVGPDELKQIVVTAVGDAVRFDCAGLTASSGTISPCTPTGFTWVGPIAGAGGLIELRFGVVSADAVARLDPDTMGTAPHLAFDEGAYRSAPAGPMVAPGAYLLIDLPATTGPDRPGHVRPTPTQAMGWTASATRQGLTVTGDGSLGSDDDLTTELAGMRHALHAGSFTADDVAVRIGTELGLTADARAFMALLVSNGDFDEATARLDVYAPWSMDGSVPDASASVDPVALRDGPVLLTHTVDWTDGWGMHVAELVVEWTEDVPGPVLVPQSARWTTSFIVVGPDASIPLTRSLSPSPAYGLEMIVWLEHWG